MDFAAGEHALSPMGASLDSAPVQRKDESGGASKDGAIAEQVPENVSLEQVRVSARLPAGRTLAGNWKYDVRTKYATNLQISVSPEGVHISCSPGLEIDAQWPAANMRVEGAGVSFSSGQSYANVRKLSGLRDGGFDMSDTARSSLTGLIDHAVAGSGMDQPGYNPLTDTNLMATVDRISSNFQSLPEGTGGGGGDAVGVADLGSPHVGATLKMQSPFEVGAGEAGVSIDAGTTLDVDIRGSGNISSLLQQSTPQGAAEAARIQQIGVRSEGIILTKGGEPIARLQNITMSPSGAVTLGRFELMGKAAGAGGFESLLRLLAGAARGAQYGPGGAELGLRHAAASGGADPTFVRGLTKSMVEQGMSAAVRKLLEENSNAIPGMDLSRVFGGA
ncbi:MAG: hypothetical protein ACI9MR_005156 [Myxococcota bacterium]|jgi:hypothetical protein